MCAGESSLIQSAAKFVIKKAKPEAPPIARKPMGFRGNHQHGRPLNDPVYPTTKVPSILKPRYRKDWRNAGRALLCVGMAAIEGNKLLKHKQCLNWQTQGPCHPRCQAECGKSPWRCMCAWRVRGLHKHIVNMDGILCDYKGHCDTSKPVFTVKRAVAEKNKFVAEAMRWDRNARQFVYHRREKNLHPGFGILHNRDEKLYDPRDRQYDSDDECVSDSTESDSESEQAAESQASDKGSCTIDRDSEEAR